MQMMDEDMKWEDLGFSLEYLLNHREAPIPVRVQRLFQDTSEQKWSTILFMVALFGSLHSLQSATINKIVKRVFKMFKVLSNQKWSFSVVEPNCC
jgi:hypothetical protein